MFKDQSYDDKLCKRLQLLWWPSTSFSAISVAMATAVSEKVEEFLTVPPEDVAVKLLLVPAITQLMTAVQRNRGQHFGIGLTEAVEHCKSQTYQARHGNDEHARFASNLPTRLELTE